MRPPPSLPRHLLLLWGLRIRVAFNRGSLLSRALGVAGWILACVPALGLFRASERAMHWAPIANSADWPPFILNLLCFVTCALFCTWPLLSAGVDDHSELSRFAAFPLAPWRLLLASTLASLFEPRALVFSAPLLGAAAGYAELHAPLPWQPLAALLAVAYFLLNACLGRVGVHLVLQVLKGPRSAELMGGFFVVFLGLCSLIPPVDTSWLTAAGAGVGALDANVLRNAALALATVPPGFFGAGLELLAQGNVRAALACLGGQTVCILGAFGAAYYLLVRFHRGPVSTASPVREGRWRPFAREGSSLSLLVVREGMDLWKNPRARLLASVPFVLAILIKLLSGRALLDYVAGPLADAWLLGSLTLYGALVMASTFSQNAFAYDGQGMAVFLTAPVPLGEVLRAKNIVHALGALALVLPMVLFYRVYFHAGSARDITLTLLAVAVLVPTVLSAGNLLSVYFPVKFHADLKRRDRLPFAASMLGVAAASVGVLPFTLTLRVARHAGDAAPTLLGLLFAALLAGVLYRVTFPVAVRLLIQRRERIYAAITRD